MLTSPCVHKPPWLRLLGDRPRHFKLPSRATAVTTFVALGAGSLHAPFSLWPEPGQQVSLGRLVERTLNHLTCLHQSTNRVTDGCLQPSEV